MEEKKRFQDKLKALFSKKPSEDLPAPLETEAVTTLPKPQSKLLEENLSAAEETLTEFTHQMETSATAIASSKKAEVNGTHYIAKHTVGFKDTLSGVAYKYYKQASEPYYRLIYEANRETIGKNMNLLRAGQTLKIPRLPEELIKD